MTRLVRSGLLARDPAVDAALRGEVQIGETPARIARQERQLSFLYKEEPLP